VLHGLPGAVPPVCQRERKAGDPLQTGQVHSGGSQGWLGTAAWPLGL